MKTLTFDPLPLFGLAGSGQRTVLKQFEYPNFTLKLTQFSTSDTQPRPRPRTAGERTARVLRSAAKGAEIGSLGGTIAGLLARRRPGMPSVNATSAAGALVGGAVAGAYRYKKDRDRDFASKVAPTALVGYAQKPFVAGSAYDGTESWTANRKPEDPFKSYIAKPGARLTVRPYGFRDTLGYRLLRQARPDGPSGRTPCYPAPPDKTPRLAGGIVNHIPCPSEAPTPIFPGWYSREDYWRGGLGPNNPVVEKAVGKFDKLDARGMNKALNRDSKRDLAARVAETFFESRPALRRITDAVGNEVDVPVPGADEARTALQYSKKPFVKKIAGRALKIGAGAGLGYVAGKKFGKHAGTAIGATVGALLFQDASVRRNVHLATIHAKKLSHL